ncbi:MAG: hypothetical protein QXR97_03210 [Thermoproteota archaeon]
MENKPLKCIVCSRIIEESSKMPFCSLHIRAYSNLAAKYGDWKRAYGELSPREFLEKIVKNEHSGRWVKEVVQAILSHGDIMQVFLEDLSSQDKRD